MKPFFCTAFFTSLCLVLFSCGSTPKPENTSVQDTKTDGNSQAVSIAIPAKKERNFFTGIPREALKAVENGSPDSINQAYSILRKEPSLYTENEKILLNVAYSLMTILWSQEKASFSPFEIPATNSYLGAIESSRHGIYDESTGENDFLTLVLPSLVLVTSESRDDYYSLSQTALSSALQINSESVVANYLMGFLLRRQDKADEALPYFKKAYENSPDCTETAYAFADINFRVKNYSKSLELAKSLVQKNPYDSSALKLCAENTFALGQLEESELYVGRVLQQEPENSYYVLFRAKILVQRGDYIRAASLLDVYARSNSDSREYLILRAKVQKDWNKNTTAATATIEKALTLYPDDVEIILSAASLAGESGTKINGKSAGELASIILEKDKNNVEAMKIQIEDFVSKKMWTRAYEVSSTLCKMKNSPKDSLYSHIEICLAAGKKDEAWNLASELYSQNQKNETAVQSYIKVLVQTGRKQEASRIIEQNFSNASSKMKSFLYYERSFLENNEDSVLVDLRSSLTSNPRNKDALFRLYQIYFNKKEYRKAQYYLKQVVAISPADEDLLKLNSELETLLSK